MTTSPTFRHFEIQGYFKDSIDSITKIYRLGGMDGTVPTPEICDMRPELKALLYIAMHSTVEGVIRRACDLFAHKFVAYRIPAGKAPSLQFLWLSCGQQYFDKKRKESSLGDVKHNSPAFFLNEVTYGELLKFVQECYHDNVNESIRNCVFKKIESSGFADPSFSGFFSASAIRAYCKYLGLNGDKFIATQRSDFDKKWEKIRRIRNEVAHGQQTLREAGRDIARVTEDCDFWRSFVTDLNNSIRENGDSPNAFYENYS